MSWHWAYRLLFSVCEAPAELPAELPPDLSHLLAALTRRWVFARSGVVGEYASFFDILRADVVH